MVVIIVVLVIIELVVATSEQRSLKYRMNKWATQDKYSYWYLKFISKIWFYRSFSSPTVMIDKKITTKNSVYFMFENNVQLLFQNYN